MGNREIYKFILIMLTFEGHHPLVCWTAKTRVCGAILPRAYMQIKSEEIVINDHFRHVNLNKEGCKVPGVVYYVIRY